MPRSAPLALALFLLAAADRSVRSAGCSTRRGAGFLLRDRPPAAFVYHAVPWIAWAIVSRRGRGRRVALACRPAVVAVRPQGAVCSSSPSMALGPGLLANTVFKDHWGRARPAQIEAFGGSHHFTPAPLPAAQCARNCSFVSGHAALGFSLVAFAFLLPPGRRRHRGIAAALGFGALVGLVRIAQGGHFLSDVVYAGLLVCRHDRAALLVDRRE